MIGVFTNSIAIVFGGILGIMIGDRIKEEYSETILKGLGIAIVVLGIQSSIKMDNPLLILISLALGALIGEVVNIEGKMESLSGKAEKKLGDKGKGFSAGFMTAALMYCAGSFAILASIQAGAMGDNSILYTKAVLDGIVSIILASTLGIGVVFSAIPVFIYQGLITFLASSFEPLMTPVILNDINSVGGILLICIGLKVTKMLEVRVGNMLPALFLPVIYHIIVGLL
ncbi:DUF554 domain-containing protein [Oceanirhabdus sp. W0125-5]|uniref:DUF554 domain-containing protein n=1 Tax=Oceanirhabdus sp. W0125-5 TaxID=2999116 RepID=UPI0022F30EBE|nr:DUF554 domain-containing protein [Oceanirhabdus sp. W0125-5]WBW96555.1 DUF554 domain-containing protein [Oceanirhabdus sp. W0125-5]